MATDFGTISYNEERPTHLGLPVNEMADTNRLLAEKYQQNKQGFEQLSLIADQVDVRDVDMGHKLNAIANIEGNISEIVEINDFEYADAKLQKTAKEFATDKNLQGAIQSRQYQLAYKSAIEDKIKNNEHFSEDYGRTWLQMAEEHNADSVEYDEETGIYKNIFKFPVPNDVQDLVGQALEIAEGWKANTYSGFSYGVDEDGNEVWQEVVKVPHGQLKMGSTKRVGFTEVFKSAMRAALERPENQAYLNDLVLVENYRLNKTYEDIPYRELVEKSTTVNQHGDEINRYTEEEINAKLEKLATHNAENPNDKITEEEFFEAQYYSDFKSGVVERATQPAAQKAAFTEEIIDFKTDLFALEAYKQQGRYRLEDYKRAKDEALFTTEAAGMELTAGLINQVEERTPQARQEVVNLLGNNPKQRVLITALINSLENKGKKVTQEEIIKILNKYSTEGKNNELKTEAEKIINRLSPVGEETENAEAINYDKEVKWQKFRLLYDDYRANAEFLESVDEDMIKGGYKTRQQIADELYNSINVGNWRTSTSKDYTREEFYEALNTEEKIFVGSGRNLVAMYKRRVNKERNKYISDGANIGFQKMRIAASSSEDAYISRLNKAAEIAVNEHGGDLLMPVGNESMKGHVAQLAKDGDIVVSDKNIELSSHTNQISYKITPSIDVGADGRHYNTVTLFYSDGTPIVYKKKGSEKGGNPVSFVAYSADQENAKSNNIKVGKSFIKSGITTGSEADKNTGIEILANSLVLADLNSGGIQTLPKGSNRRMKVGGTEQLIKHLDNGNYSIGEGDNPHIGSNPTDLALEILTKSDLGTIILYQNGINL